MQDHLNIITKLVTINHHKSDNALSKIIKQALEGLVDKPLDHIRITINRSKKHISILPANLYTATILATMMQNSRNGGNINYPTIWSSKKTSGYAFKYGNFVWEKPKGFVLECNNW
ncbi:MAG: hypothetical protein GF411_14345 [Candidatus Lokiarchaeota archaeon]|nr:hypothetical protein [Candidatus Lokiarchaeota archaeon]